MCRFEETIRGFKGIIDGEYDHLPEQAFIWLAPLTKRLRKPKTYN